MIRESKQEYHIDTVEKLKDGGSNQLPYRILNGYPEGAETMRRIIEQMSTPMVSYNTYPAVDLIKRHAVTVFVHDGYDGIPTDLLGPSLKMANPDMHGDFEVIDSRTLKIKGRKDCRLLSLDCSPEFLDFLATKPRNFRYPMISHKVYINGGKRSDSPTEYTAPRLSHEDSAKLVKSQLMDPGNPGQENGTQEGIHGKVY